MTKRAGAVAKSLEKAAGARIAAARDAGGAKRSAMLAKKAPARSPAAKR